MEGFFVFLFFAVVVFLILYNNKKTGPKLREFIASLRGKLDRLRSNQPKE